MFAEKIRFAVFLTIPYSVSKRATFNGQSSLIELETRNGHLSMVGESSKNNKNGLIHL